MEGLLKQVRKFSGKEEIGSFREGRTQPQRTPSFRGERKPQKWLKRQFSRQMSFNHSIEEAEYAAAIAAAAFAITALDSDIVDRRKPETERRPSLSRIISGLINPAFPAEPSEPPKNYAGEYNDETARMVPEKTIHPVPSIKRNPSMPKKRLTFADELEKATRNRGTYKSPFSSPRGWEDPSNPYIYASPIGSPREWEEADKIKPTSSTSFRRTSTVKKTPSFDEKELEDAQRMKPTSTPSFRRTRTAKKTPSFGEESMEDSRRMKSPKRPAPQRILPPPILPPPAIPPLNLQPISPPKRPQRTRGQEDDADVWERDEMAKIKQRYDKLSKTILEWEDKKKKKARRKLEMTERDPEKRRAKAMHNYQIEMERIKQIADGARSQAKAKQINEELKVRDKASRYRATGEPPVPPMCLCL